MKFYVASTLSNADMADAVADLLIERGWKQTYRWTKHGAVGDQGMVRIAEVAAAEQRGVAEAEVVVVVLPGLKGTHVELGLAMAMGKDIWIIDPTGEHNVHEATNTFCCFWTMAKGRFGPVREGRRKLIETRQGLDYYEALSHKQPLSSMDKTLFHEYMKAWYQLQCYTCGVAAAALATYYQTAAKILYTLREGISDKGVFLTLGEQQTLLDDAKTA